MMASSFATTNSRMAPSAKSYTTGEKLPLSAEWHTSLGTGINQVRREAQLQVAVKRFQSR